jgi:hypothetical protein
MKNSTVTVKKEQFICKEHGKIYNKANQFAGHLTSYSHTGVKRNKKISEENKQNSSSNTKINSVVMSISPEDWVKWNYELLQKLEEIKQYNSILELDNDSIRKENELLQTEIKRIEVKITEVKLHNEQALGYQDYQRK